MELALTQCRFLALYVPAVESARGVRNENADWSTQPYGDIRECSMFPSQAHDICESSARPPQKLIYIHTALYS